MSAQAQCPSWCEECWEITPDVTKHTKRFNITTTWHPVLQRWDHRYLTLDVHTGPGASTGSREQGINFNMVNAGPDEALRVAAAIEAAAKLIDQELEQEAQKLLEQEAASR